MISTPSRSSPAQPSGDFEAHPAQPSHGLPILQPTRPSRTDFDVISVETCDLCISMPLSCGIAIIADPCIQVGATCDLKPHLNGSRTAEAAQPAQPAQPSSGCERTAEIAQPAD